MIHESHEANHNYAILSSSTTLLTIYYQFIHCTVILVKILVFVFIFSLSEPDKRLFHQTKDYSKIHFFAEICFFFGNMFSFNTIY